MNRPFLSGVLFAGLIATLPAHADPIHEIADGAYWHHDSGWIYPAQIAAFSRVSVPQDVAGSKNAVAYYARVADGLRLVASVDVYPVDSADAEGLAEDAGILESDTPFVVGAKQSLSGTRRIFRTDRAKAAFTVLYFISAGEWCVRIRAVNANTESLPMLDEFARQQQWTSLSGAPTPR
jgi:hypothetical protein